MNKPTFLGVGTQKAGTTSMYSILRNHPQIFLPETKEIHYFDKYYHKPVEWYLRYFDKATNENAIGEITTNYIYDKPAPERIFNILGKNIKLIFILRNPADRAFSNYKMNIERQNETLTFKKVIERDLIQIKKKIDYNTEFHYIKRGFYVDQIKRYLKLFNRNNMLILLFEEDIIKNRKKTFEKIYDFLDVDILDLPVNVKITPNTKYKSKKFNKILNTSHPINQFAKKLIPSQKTRTNIKYLFTKLNQKPVAQKSELEEIRAMLINNIYKSSILELQDLTGKDLSDWLII
ncbi:MAG: sulfotransferase domain-containing protein [Bacteroidales bacterium]|nr:sulfotransferase domain-containing protein [Bacteroidales bacterium]